MKSDFLIADEYSYFCSNIRGPLLKSASFEIQKYLQRGILDLEYSFVIQDLVRKKLGKYLNISKDELTLTKCASDGINIIAQGLDLTENDQIIITDQEFPANIYPWKNTKAEVIKIKTDQGKVSIETFKKAITSKTKLIATSSTFYQTGFNLALNDLIQFCAEKNVLLLIDAVQTLGYQKIDCSKIDFVVGDSRKYFGSLDGLGFLTIKEKHLEKIKPKFVGFYSYVENDILKENAQRFELSGSKPTLSLIALYKTLEYFEKHSIDYELKKIFQEKIQKLGLNYYQFDENQSHLFILKNRKNFKIEELQKFKILASVQSNKIFIALHYITDLNALNALLEVL